MRREGFEPSTSRLSAVRSTKLSHPRKKFSLIFLLFYFNCRYLKNFFYHNGKLIS